MLGGKRVLILEDEPIIAFALEDMIDAIGCPVIGVAYRVLDALEMLASAPCDAAVLDVNIAGEQSYPVADALVARGIPFVFATGYGDCQHPKRFAHCPTVTKPYSMEQIRHALMIAVREGPEQLMSR